MKTGIVINDYNVFPPYIVCRSDIADYFCHDISIERIIKIAYEGFLRNFIVRCIPAAGFNVAPSELTYIFLRDRIERRGEFDADYFFKPICGRQKQRFPLPGPEIDKGILIKIDFQGCERIIEKEESLP